MATTITELNTDSGKQEERWVLNITSNDASGGINIRDAVTDYRHGIKNISLIAGGNQWIKLLDGENVILGPIVLASGIPWSYNFQSSIYCTRGNALILKTQSAFGIFCVIEGNTGIPVPSSSVSASPSE